MNKSGRGATGDVLIRGRCNKAIKKCVLINYKPFYIWNVSLVLGVLRQVTNSVFIILLKFGCGALTYCAMTHGTIPGQYKYYLFFRKLNFRNFFKSGTRVFVRFLTNKTVFCQLALRNSYFVKYLRAAGTYTRLYQRYHDYRLISCRLPTKKIKFILYSTLVTLGRNSNVKHKKEFLTKAGANILKGFKSKVRGVAMNPVDHPHGGRTKSNSPEKSPWGWIAKKNK